MTARPRPRVCFRDESCPSPKHHDDYLGYNGGCRSAAAIIAEDRYRRGLDPKSAPMVGVRRRLQGLAVLGWSPDSLAERASRSPANIKSLRSNNRDRCRMDTWVWVTKMYRDLSESRGPSEITAQRARRAGWLAPIMWDDDSLDDADAKPGYRPRRRPTELTGNRREDIAALTAADWTAQAIADRLDVSKRHVTRVQSEQRQAAS